MKRITEQIESLNVVREKCKRKDTDFKKDELVHLNLAFMELQQSYGKKHVKPINRSCSFCVVQAMRVVHNYIVNEEPKVDLYKNVSELTVDLDTSQDNVYPAIDYKVNVIDDAVTFEDLAKQTHPKTEEDLTSLSLKELRAKFPNVRARSIEKFIELLKEQ